MSDSPKARLAEGITAFENGVTCAQFIEEGVFLSFHSPSAGSGCAFAVSEKALIGKSLLSVLERVKETQGAKDLRGLEIKLVGTEEAVNRAARVIHREGLKVLSRSTKPTGRAEVVFYPDTGRLRVAWSAAEASSASMPPAAERKLDKVRVLIVDDSPTIRKILVSIFEGRPDFEVVGTAERPSEVEALIEKTRPNVLTLDIHMPEMDGVALLKELYPKYGIPAVMITSVSREEGPLVLEALENGAVDYIQKPTFSGLAEATPLIQEKVRSAAQNRRKRSNVSRGKRRELSTELVDLDSVVAIGSSTGGTEALRDILTQLPDKIPPIVCVQHIPAVFSEALANRLNDLCAFEVKEAVDGDALLPNRVLIAPGGKQMRVVKSGTGFKVTITDEAPVNRHKPSVDVLFESVAKSVGAKAIGVILTGMGADGARELLTLKDLGARTIAQDEESCVVFGMPREAIRLGAAQEIRALEEIPDLLIRWISRARAA